MRKIISLIKAKRRNAGLEQLKILTAGSRRDDVSVLTFILRPIKQIHVRRGRVEFIIHNIAAFLRYRQSY